MRSRARMLVGLGLASVAAATACPVAASAAPGLAPATVAQPRLYLTPTASTVKAGSSLAVDVRLDTGGHPVNVAEVVLAYPTAVLTLNSFDTSKSALKAGFDPGAPAGVVDHVAYTPGGTAPVSGNILIGTLHFTGSTAGGSATLCVSNSSTAVDSSTNVDIGASIANADVTVGTASTPRLGCLAGNLVGQGAVQSVTLAGSGLTKGSPVTVSGTGVSATAVAVSSAGVVTSKVTVAPGATTGFRDVSVKVGTKTITCNNCLRIEQGPQVSAVDPSTIARGSTTTVTVTGRFGPQATITVPGAGITVSSVTWVNYQTLTAVVTTSAAVATGTHTVNLYDPTPHYGDGGRTSCTGCLSVTN